MGSIIRIRKALLGSCDQRKDRILEYLVLGNWKAARTTTNAPGMEVGAHVSQIISIVDCTIAATAIFET